MADIRAYPGDTVRVEFEFFDEDTEQPISIQSISWSLQRPDGTAAIINGDPPVSTTTPLNYTIMSRDTVTLNSTAYPPYTVFLWDGSQWNFVDTGISNINPDHTVATFLVPGAITEQLEGAYNIRAQAEVNDLTLNASTYISQVKSFEIVDPLAAPSTDVASQAIDHAMMKLEDLFDSELGGPWLQDKTVKSFGRDKMLRLMPDALYLINNAFVPATTFADTDFPTEHMPLLAQALLIESIYQLIRSYVEQYNPSGAQISWFDRRDYMQRWQSVLQTEEQKFYRYLDIFHQSFLGFGQTAMLLGGYSSPMTRMSKFWRTRYPRWIGPWGM